MKPGFTTESDGSPSSYRLMMLIGVFVIIGIWAFTNIYSVMHPREGATSFEMIDFTVNALGVIGLLIGGKVFQKFKESPPKGGEPAPEGQ